MSDFSAGDLALQYNTGTDASPVWTGTAIQFGGSSGANELRFCASGAGAASTPSASWPYVTRPTSGTAVIPELWAFTADTTGSKVLYNGTNGYANVLRWNWGTSGTFAAAPQIGAFANSSHTAPSPGTQPPGTNNDAITNGSTDTSNTSYLKAAAYGTIGTSNMTAGTVGTAPTATTGAAGAITASGAAWSSWQSLQGFTQYLILGSTPAATTANAWNWVLILYTGVNMTTGTIVPVFTFQYAYS